MARTTLPSLLWLAFAAAATPVAQCQSAFEIRPVVDSLRQRAIRMIEEGSNREVFVGGDVFFNISDVDSVTLYSGKEADGTPLHAVNIALRQSLTDSVRSLTARLVGSRLAIIVGGRIVATPKILDPIQTARFGVFTETDAEAKDLAGRISKAMKAQ